MAKKSNKELAKELFIKGFSIDEIANILKVKPSTVSRNYKDNLTTHK